MSKETIQAFYDAFAKRDAEGMVALYADDVRFSDPAFGPLSGERARNMWRMLAGRSKDLRIEASRITDSSAHWEAHYTFSQTGRKVHNVVDATFTFKDGKIARHDDVFDFWRWSRQALGAPGLLLGWTGFFHRSVQARALAGLDAFERTR